MDDDDNVVSSALHAMSGECVAAIFQHLSGWTVEVKGRELNQSENELEFHWLTARTEETVGS